MAQNLGNREGVFYARITVPKRVRDLRAERGLPNPKEISRSLETRNPDEARLRLADFLAMTLRSFEAAERELRATPRRALVKPSNQDIQRALWEFSREERELDELERTSRPSANEIERDREKLVARLKIDPPKSELALLTAPGVLELMVAQDAAGLSAERRHSLAKELREHLAASNYVLIDWAVQQLAHRRGWLIEPESTEYKSLARKLILSWLSVLETADKRDQGIYDEVGTLPEPTPILGATREASLGSGRPMPHEPVRGESLADYFDTYVKEVKAKTGKSTKIDLRATLRQFVECNGSKRVMDYGKADMSTFKKGLLTYPTNAEKHYPSAHFDQVIERNKKDGLPTLKDRSVRNKLSALSAFGRWLEHNVDGVQAENFRTSLPMIDDAGRMEPFTDDEVRRILNSYAFTGAKSEHDYQRPGAFKWRDWHFWLPLIAAFTGARLNEITQLRAADVVQVGGLWAFKVSDEGDNQSLKTRSSKRLIPVHPQLLALGLIGYRDAVIAQGETELFFQIKRDANGRRSTAAGKWFRKFLGLIGVKGKGDLGGAHRWRHTLTDALRKAGVDDYDAATLLGHSTNVAKMTGHYGREMAMTLAKQSELLAKATYPTVDFTLLG